MTQNARLSYIAAMNGRSRIILSSMTLTLRQLTYLWDSRTSVRILYYHSISDGRMRSSVSPAAFESQMEYLLRNNYRILSLSEVTQYIASCTPFPERSLTITLDDGFQDNYENAFPILRRVGFKATIFLAVSYIGTDRLATLTEAEFIPRPLAWDQVKEMHQHGIEFGSHTRTHPMLSQISHDEARREIRESKRTIEEALGTPVHFFCYPRGDFNDAVKRIVKEEGYLAACTTLPGLNDWTTDLFALRRTYVSRRDTAREFAKKVAGAYDVLQQALHLWRRLRRR